MDPLTALSVATNVITVLDASVKAMILCRQIYRHGASPEHLQVQDITKHVQEALKELDSSLERTTSFSAVDARLAQLCDKCQETASTLIKELTSLQAGQGRRAAAVRFIQAKRKASLIERLKKQLDDYQRTLDTQMLVDIRRQLRSAGTLQHEQYSKIAGQLSQINVDLSQCSIPIATNLKDSIELVIATSREEHEKTRNYMHRDLEALTHAKVVEESVRRSRDQFLESLRFDEINLRKNTIQQSYPDTFGWIFEKPPHNLWSDFDYWLRNAGGVYWIHGKPGSGKSTLMRFLFYEDRTIRALDAWSRPKNHVKLAFFFWLAGSKIQRSMQGLLASLLYQILNLKTFSDDTFHDVVSKFGSKRNIYDWTISELRVALSKAVLSLTKVSKVCLFLDGIDEFDQEDDIGVLLDFIEELSKLHNLKLCLASRSEARLKKRLMKYPKLRLQDLTKPDMEMVVSQELQRAFHRERRAVPSAVEFQNLIDEMVKKADGVFLWVHYALQSLRKGIADENNAKTLERRLEELRPGMEQLYTQMWQRLNGDESLYQTEASEYFALAISALSMNQPLGLFQAAVAMNVGLRSQYLAEPSPQRPADFAKICRDHKLRIETRCAGLLMLQLNEHRDRIRRRSTTDLRQHTKNLNIPTKDRLALGTSWETYKNARMDFIHRTAYDFLLNTESGKLIAGEPKTTHRERCENLVIGAAAYAIQEAKWYSIRLNITQAITYYEFSDDDEFLGKLRPLIEAQLRGARGSKPHEPLSYVPFMISKCLLDYAWRLSSIEFEKASPYYLGHLFQVALPHETRYYSEKHIQFLRWLLNRKADLRTQQWCPTGRIQAPIESLIERVVDEIYFNDIGSSSTLHLLALLLEEILASQAKTNDVFSLSFTSTLFPSSKRLSIHVRVGMHWIYKMALWLLNEANIDPQSLSNDTIVCSLQGVPLINVLSHSILPKASKTFEVLAFRIGGHFLLNPQTSFSNYLWVPDPERKMCISQVLPPAPQSSAKSDMEFFYQGLQRILKTSSPNCSLVHEDEWLESMGMVVSRSPDAPYLNPFHEVDESNWWSKGWSLERYPSSQSLKYGIVPRKTPLRRSRSDTWLNTRRGDVIPSWRRQKWDQL